MPIPLVASQSQKGGKTGLRESTAPRMDSLALLPLCLPVAHRFESCSAITMPSWSTSGLESLADDLIVHCEINDESSQDKTIFATFPASRTEKILSGTLVGPGLVDLVDARVAFRRAGLVRHGSGQAYRLALLTETAAT